MKPINVKIDANSDFNSAQSAAADKLPLALDASSLVSWYDRKNKTGGPLEACGDQPLKTSQDYARANGAEYRVSAGKRFEFFYSSIPEGTEQLDPEALIEIHKGLEYDRYENVQGG